MPDGVTGDPGPTAHRTYTDANHPDANRSGVPMQLTDPMATDQDELPLPLQNANLQMYATLSPLFVFVFVVSFAFRKEKKFSQSEPGAPRCTACEHGRVTGVLPVSMAA